MVIPAEKSNVCPLARSRELIRTLYNRAGCANDNVPTGDFESLNWQKNTRAKGKNVTSNKKRMSYKGLTIEKGPRHCKIVDEDGDVAFRTTNLKDARKFLSLMKERDRLERLLESRGIAPHRIYLLAADEDMRGKVNSEGAAAKEVVIVAKSEDGGLVVRHLGDGREEIVDPEEIESIEGGPYLRASDVQDEVMHVILRFNRENEGAHVAVFRTPDSAGDLVEEWKSAEESPGTEYEATVDTAEGDAVIFRAEVIVED